MLLCALAPAEPELASVAYDEAVAAALCYLSFHPEHRSQLKPVLTEIVARAKKLKADVGQAKATARGKAKA